MMKVNFNTNFRDFDGQQLLIDGKPVCIGRIVAQCLFGGSNIRQTGNAQIDNDKKMQAYNLCMRVMNAHSEIDITAEEAVLIKEAISGLTPGCFAQIVKLIEG
jgi:hypothetical protein|nr:MAG TPA_asm: hypothetical protein [Caudoviricetes sp.]